MIPDLLEIDIVREMECFVAGICFHLLVEVDPG